MGEIKIMPLSLWPREFCALSEREVINLKPLNFTYCGTHTFLMWILNSQMWTIATNNHSGFSS